MPTPKKFLSTITVITLLLAQVGYALPSFAKPAVPIKKPKPVIPVGIQTAPVVAPDWSVTDWDAEVVTLPDMEAHQQKVDELARAGKAAEAAALRPAKRKMTDEAVLDYYGVPEAVRESVRDYKISVEGKGEAEKQLMKESLKRRIKSLQPASAVVKTDTNTQVINVKNAPKLKIKKLVPVNEEKVKIYKADLVSTRSLNKRENKLFKITPAGIKNIKAKLPKTKKAKISLGDWWSNAKSLAENLFHAETAYAEGLTPFITYYDGIEKNLLDNALYYLSNHQNADDSVGDYNQYELTAKIALQLTIFNRTDSDQYASMINYLRTAEPQDNREKFLKARVQFGANENYLPLLDEAAAEQRADGGYGLDTDYVSDVDTTLEAALTMWVAQYSLEDKLPKALNFVLNKIESDGAMRFTTNGDPSYHLINKTAEYLYPFSNLSVGDDQNRISVQSKIDLLLSYLGSHYDENTGILLGTRDAIDEMATLYSFRSYNAYLPKQASLEEKAAEAQSFDGSFGSSLYAMIAAMKVLDKADLEITTLTALDATVNKAAARFNVTIRNNGYAASTGTILYIFKDNLNAGEKLDLSDTPIEPNGEINLNLTISDTLGLIGDTEIKLYVENIDDADYDDNWKAVNFNFAAAVDGSPALPLYFIAQKYEAGGSPGLNIRWPQKNDANRANYVAMWRVKGTQDWAYFGILNTWNGAFLAGGFNEGTVYEVTAGVLHLDGDTVTYYNNLLSEVKMSGNSDLYLGGVTGYATNNEASLPSTFTWAYSAGGNTGADGVFNYSRVKNGSTAAWVKTDYFEPIVTKINVPISATSTDTRLFTRLKPDSVSPSVNFFEMQPSRNFSVNNQRDVTLLVSGTDNIGIKSADFYFFDPAAGLWIYIGSKSFTSGASDSMGWYLPAGYVGDGYKFKTVIRDFQGNESPAAEWGPFSIIDGTVPSFSINSPVDNEQLALGTTHNISWDTISTHNVPRVNMSLVYPSGKVNTFAFGATNSGSYAWSVPNNSSYSGNNLKIRLTGSDTVNGLSGVSDSAGTFSIADNSPVPSAPWGAPQVVTSTLTVPGSGNVSKNNLLLKADSNGDEHMVYHWIQDIMSDSGRTIVERLYHTVNVAGVWTEAVPIYEKIWLTDNNLTGYNPLTSIKLEIDGSNNFHLSALSSGDGSGCIGLNGYEAYYMRYNGVSWSALENISNNNTMSDAPDLAVDGLGNPHIVWSDGISFDESCGSSGTKILNYLTKNGDGSWKTVSVLSSADYPNRPQIAVNAGGKVNVVYAVNGQSKLGYISGQNGIWNPLTYFFTDPAIDEPELKSGQGNNLHYVFRQWYTDPATGSGRARILYASYDGSNWAEPIEVSPTASGYDSDRPELNVVGDAPQVLFEYKNNSNGRRSLMWVTKNNRGWMPAQAISRESNIIEANSPQISFGQGKLGAVYVSGYSGNSEIFYNEADMSVDYLAPLSVSGVSVTAAVGEVDVGWDRYANVDGDFDHFNIYRRVSSGNPEDEPVRLGQVRDALAVRYVDLTGIIGTDYDYAVAVVDRANKESIYSWVGPVTPSRPPQPKISLSADAQITNRGIYNFNAIETLTSKETVFTITNDGSTDLRLSGSPLVKLSGIGVSSFVVISQPQAVIVGGGSTTFVVAFRPTVPGVKAAVLEVRSNDTSNARYIINLRGSTIPGPTVYENAEDGLITGWKISDNIPAGARISNVVDDAHGRVIQLLGAGTANAYELYLPGNKIWANPTQKVIQWDMKFNEDYYVAVRVNTRHGRKWLSYSHLTDKKASDFVPIRTDVSLRDGAWHTVVHNLVADLAIHFPTEIIKQVELIRVYGSGMLDNIQLLDTMP
ncbi:MAG: hypothetical protein Q7S66_03840 [bacterium]|nr:hypothetical protein [bacterium]